MRRGLLMLVVVMGLAAVVRAQAKPDDADADEPWQVVADEGVAIIVPRDWKNLDRFQPKFVVFRQDQTGESDPWGASQMSLSVERYRIPDSIDKVARVIAATKRKEEGVELSMRPVLEAVELSDKSFAGLLTMEYIKGDKRWLERKLLVKVGEENGFLVSGTISAAKESKTPTPESAAAAWLKAHLMSFVLDDKKVDREGIKKAYADKEKSQAK